MMLEDLVLLTKGLYFLREGLAPFVEGEMSSAYGMDWPEKAEESLRRGAPQGDQFSFERPYDVQALLKIMDHRWEEVFRRKLRDRAKRGLVIGLLDVRNKWAHQRSFSTIEAFLALGTAKQLLECVAANEQAHQIDDVMARLVPRLFQAAVAIQATDVARPVVRKSTSHKERPTYADSVRAHVVERYIKPARQAGQKLVSVRAGDIHKELGWKSRHALICTALGGNRFAQAAGVRLVQKEGPPLGGNTRFWFEIEPATPHFDKQTLSGSFEPAVAFFARHRDELLRGYEGKFIAIIDEKVVDSDVDRVALAHRVYAKHGYKAIYMPKVERTPRVVRIPTPFLR
ncbi:MAG: hypothetical protein HYY02_02290 [Chloroflexi bacterium]|nr:hypothetical protein [Chloroflexota bacterium]